VTAYGREDAVHSAERQGTALKAVLTKPVTPSNLLDTLAGVLGKRRFGDGRSQQRDEAARESMQQLRGAKLLLVEDNELNRELAVELLRGAGIEVRVAVHGGEALERLREESFDGVLMDCQMPVMDGYTAAREIRKDPARQSLPIIAMTANAMVGDREKVLDAGMNDHIAKPLDVGEMFATIARWVRPSTPVPAATALHRAGHSPDGLADLPGLDTRAGLSTTLGNSGLYRRLLKKFRAGNLDFEAAFRQALADPDPRAAERLAHSLKGTAGNIGAKAVQAAAYDLEWACREGAGTAALEGALAKVLAALAPVMAGLEGLAQREQEPAPAGPPADPEGVRANLAALEGLIADFDTAAADTAAALAGLLAGTRHAALGMSVLEAIEGYDFDLAADLLERLVRAVAEEP
jgi:two-component system sensor histidine kinase/response regulator